MFSKKANGGMINVIRCDLKEYLVWKWRPKNQEVNTTTRENAIRWGSSLRVKDGEMAIFVYSQGDKSHDVIYGPCDKKLDTANLPVLANLLGLAYNGNSPFQAEVYFINLALNIQIHFAVVDFDIFDPRYPEMGIPCIVRGTMTFNIKDYKEFIKNNRLINFELMDFKNQVKSAVMRYVKSAVISLPKKQNISVMQIESQILEINDLVKEPLSKRLSEDFGINLRGLDIEAVELNKQSQNYIDLKRMTVDIQRDQTLAQAQLNLQNMYDSQKMTKENLSESMRLQREETQRAQRLKSEQTHLGAHSVDVQGDVMKTAARSMGQMNGSFGDGNGKGGSGGGFNPGGMMAGMMMGGAVGQQMAGMMNQMGQQMNQQYQQGQQQYQQQQVYGGQVPPPPPQMGAQYFVSTNGQTQGPYNVQAMANLVKTGFLTPDTYIWKQGMANWAFAKDTELNQLFMQTTPPPPPPPPVK